MKRQPVVIAHRGGAKGADAAERDALGAFSSAIDEGATMIEFDVRRTADGEFIVFHDSKIDGSPVNELTLADVERIVAAPALRLGELVDFAAGRASLDVEVKEAGYVQDIVNIVLDAVNPASVMFTSFHPSVVAEIKCIEPNVRAGLILGFSNLSLSPVAKSIACGADFVVPGDLISRTGVTRRAAEQGLQSIVWTVNSKRRLEKVLSDERVWGVITDRPALATRLISERSREAF